MPGENYHNSKTVHYICPFFQSEKGNSICCEGLVKNSANKTCFTKKAAMERYRSRFCFDFHYTACHWAQILFEKKYPSDL